MDAHLLRIGFRHPCRPYPGGPPHPLPELGIARLARLQPGRAVALAGLPCLVNNRRQARDAFSNSLQSYALSCHVNVQDITIAAPSPSCLLCSHAHRAWSCRRSISQASDAASHEH